MLMCQQVFRKVGRAGVLGKTVEIYLLNDIVYLYICKSLL